MLPPMLAVTLAIAVYLLVAIAALASARPEYSHLRDTISQLGERGAVRAKLMGRGVFVPVGLGLWGIALWMRASNGHAALLAFCIGTGYLVGGAFPCDRGLPPHGSWRQQIHEASGFIEYAGGAYSIYRLASAQGSLAWLFYGAMCFVPFAAAAAFIRPLRPVRGLIQRVAECLLFGTLALAIRAT
jgi:hypothetical protein